MKKSELQCLIEGVVVIDLDSYQDERGQFMETFNAGKFAALGIETEFKQANESVSFSGVLRGMHIQANNPQGKLVRCVYGTIYDAFVDLRYGSKTFGKWDGIWLTWKQPQAIYIPPGVAHGFYTASSVAILNYLCTTLYDKESDGGVLWNDPEIGIEWPFSKDFVPIVSTKDMSLPSIGEIKERYEQLHRLQRES
jgi:dTDP-4-dehydrorhamnose 3,5-epimerase